MHKPSPSRAGQSPAAR